MKYYYYEILCKDNGKRYIGITTNPIVRKNRHFNYLRQNKHPNPIMQAAFNYYGEDSFIFSVFDDFDTDNKEEAYAKESYYIQTKGNFPEGFNCNIGGTHCGPKGDFSEEQVFEILSTKEFLPNSGRFLSQLLNLNVGTVNNILCEVNYKYWAMDYHNLPFEERKKIYDNFNRKYSFEEKYILQNRKPSSRRHPSEDIYVALFQKEFGIPKVRKELMTTLNFANYSSFDTIYKGTSYRTESYLYNKMSFKEKISYMYHYAEMHNPKLRELLENLEQTISSQAAEVEGSTTIPMGVDSSESKCEALNSKEKGEDIV